MFQALEGGCLCGAVRYRVSAQPIDAGYCHCRLCQRSSGAPVLAWLTVPVHGFSYTKDRVAIFHSSSHSQREFCGTCGTQIAFRRSSSPKAVDVTLASLDDQSLVAPQYHIWRQSKVAWFETTDSLPRYEDSGPDYHET
ncbi:MAG: GFA family protein [Nevskiales bacterium]